MPWMSIASCIPVLQGLGIKELVGDQSIGERASP